MDTTTTPNFAPQAGAVPALGDRIRHSKALIPTLAVLLVTVAALGATLVATRSGAQGDGRGPSQAMASQTQEEVTAPPLKSAAQPAARPAPVRQAQQQAPAQARGPNTAMGNTASACRNCGVVESVVAVQRQVPVQGIANSQVTAGAVAGGVIGGLLGNQVGHGNGRAAATVLGAAGGAYAGNEIQKTMNKVTVYQVRVRMHDGSVRTVEQGSTVPAGAQVVVEGGALRPA
ncbi:MAG TPA: glycine zipper 2TM domain-containing protein [Ramlibacter sp.]|nr:glycine zipper 2TM domain-containing protein [Ramlibacter sp.]